MNARELLAQRAGIQPVRRNWLTRQLHGLRARWERAARIPYWTPLLVLNYLGWLATLTAASAGCAWVWLRPAFLHSGWLYYPALTLVYVIIPSLVQAFRRFTPWSGDEAETAPTAEQCALPMDHALSRRVAEFAVKVGVVMPVRVTIDLSSRASMSFDPCAEGDHLELRIGAPYLGSLRADELDAEGDHLELRIGAPYLASLRADELDAIIYHELGHARCKLALPSWLIFAHGHFQQGLACELSGDLRLLALPWWLLLQLTSRLEESACDRLARRMIGPQPTFQALLRLYFMMLPYQVFQETCNGLRSIGRLPRYLPGIARALAAVRLQPLQEQSFRLHDNRDYKLYRTHPIASDRLRALGFRPPAAPPSYEESAAARYPDLEELVQGMVRKSLNAEQSLDADWIELAQLEIEKNLAAEPHAVFQEPLKHRFWREIPEIISASVSTIKRETARLNEADCVKFLLRIEAGMALALSRVGWKVDLAPDGLLQLHHPNQAEPYLPWEELHRLIKEPQRAGQFLIRSGQLGLAGLQLD